MVVWPLEALLLAGDLSLVNMTGFDLFGMYVLNMSSLNIALLGVRFHFTSWC